MTQMDQYSWNESWWDFIRIDTDRSEIKFLQVAWCPIIHFSKLLTSFFNVKSIIISTLELIHQVRGFAVSKVGDGISQVGFIATAGPSQGLSKHDIYFLLNPQPCTPSLYILHTIHKSGNPDHSFFASFSSPMKHVSAYIDTQLKPIVKSLPSHFKDIHHFLNCILSLPTLLPPNTNTAIDVTSLYTNIPHPWSLCIETLPKLVLPHSLISTQFLIQLTHFIITQNHYSFNSQHYLHTSAWPLSFANLFIGFLKQEFLHSTLRNPALGCTLLTISSSSGLVVLTPSPSSLNVLIAITLSNSLGTLPLTNHISG
jgi:hypothetical protein